METEVSTPETNRKKIIIVGVGGLPSDDISKRIAELSVQYDAIIEYQELKEGETDHVIAVGFDPNLPEITMPFIMSPYLSVMGDIRPYMYEDLMTTVNYGKSLSKHARNATKEELDAPKVGRNELCPCGSNLKFKKCHGK